MNVGIDISQIVYEGTGSARYVHNLLRGFVDIAVNADLELTLFGSAYKKRNLLNSYAQLGKNAKYYPFPPRFFELLWNKLHVVNFEEFAGKVDIYHSSDWTQAPSKAKKVTTVHDLIPFLYPDYVHPRIRVAHKERWRWIEQEVDYVIVDAECTKRDILKMFKLSEERIMVIPLGVEQRFVEIGKQKLAGEMENNWKISAEVTGNEEIKFKNYVLAVGTLEPRKNIARLIQAYAVLHLELARKYPLVIVGKKAWGESLEVPKDRKVIFTGYVEDEILSKLYAGAALFVMPSLYEGFGIPVLEAMACATPVLAANEASLPEVGGSVIEYFQDAQNELAMADDLCRALENVDLVKVEKAFARSKEMTWAGAASQTLQLYKKMYNNH